MTELGGPTTESGIFFQNQVAALYLGRLIDPRQRSRDEIVQKVRLEAPPPVAVDDIVVRFADDHSEYVQVKEEVSRGSRAWKELWKSFAIQRGKPDFIVKDRIVLVLGNPYPWAGTLRAVCGRAEGAEDEGEWRQRLAAKHEELLGRIEHIIGGQPNAPSLLELFASCEVRILDPERIKTDQMPNYMPESNVGALRLFDTLLRKTSQHARIRKTFKRASLLKELAHEGIEVPGSAGGEAAGLLDGAAKRTEGERLGDSPVSLRPGFDYATDISRGVRRFIGREWLVAEFDRWLRQDPAPRLLLVGDMGVGKSAFVSHLCETHEAVVAWHFCVYLNRERCEPLYFVESLAYQLSQELPGFREALVSSDLEKTQRDPYGLCERLLVIPLSRIRRPPRPVTLIVDAVDEAAGHRGDDFVSLLAWLSERLPEWLGVVVTSRPDAAVEGRLSRFTRYRLRAEDPRNLDDLRRFLERELAGASSHSETVEALFGRSSGLFLYARTVLEGLQRGWLAAPGVAEFPSGLSSIFRFLFERYFPNIERYADCQRPLFELVLAAHGPLPLELAASILGWSPYRRREAVESLAAVFAMHEGMLVPVHVSLLEWLGDPERAGRYFASGDEGAVRWVRRSAEGLGEATGAARRYLRRHAIDHLLEADLGAAPGSAERVLGLCREGTLLSEARREELHYVTDQLRRALVGYATHRRWYAAASMLIYLRWLRRLGDSLRDAVGFLVQPSGAEDFLAALQRLLDERMQRGLALLAVHRLDRLGDDLAREAVLDWMTARHPSSLAFVSGVFDTEALEAVLTQASPELGTRLAHGPLFVDEKASFQALAFLYYASRAQEGVALIQVIDADSEACRLPPITVAYLAGEALRRRDGELAVLCLEWLVTGGHEFDIEKLDLPRLLELPWGLGKKALTALFRTHRVQQYPALREQFAAVVLMGKQRPESPEFQVRAVELAALAEVTQGAVACEFARLVGFATGLWRMTPAELDSWLRARVALLHVWAGERGGAAASAPPAVSAIRKMINKLCIVVRWVAAQAEPSDDDRTAVSSLLSTLSSYAWNDPGRWGEPAYDQQNGWRTEGLDPLRLYACRRTANWLAEWTGYGEQDAPISANLQDAAASVLAALVFPDVAAEHQERLGLALSAAWSSPPLRRDKPADDSPWTELLKILAESVGVDWRRSWSEVFKSDRRWYGQTYPAPLEHALDQALVQVAKTAAVLGCHEELVALSASLAVAMGDDRKVDRNAKVLMGAISGMDPRILRDVEDGGPGRDQPCLPLYLCRTVPAPLADAIAALEVSEYGAWSQMSRNLCQARSDPEWRDSLRRFRTRFLDAVAARPPKARWDEDPAKMVASLLAPVNLVIDEPPSRADFEALRRHGDLTPTIVAARPHPDLLRWAAELDNARNLGLLAPTIQEDRWDLLPSLLLGRDKGEDPEILLGGFERVFALSSARLRHVDLDERLRALLGFGYEEGLVHRLPSLVREVAGPDADVATKLDRYRSRVRLAADWRQGLRDLWLQIEFRRRTLVRCILGAALVSGQRALLEIIDEFLAQVDEPELEADYLWVASVVSPETPSEERVLRLARSAIRLDTVAHFGTERAVLLHLENATGKGLLKWYHECQSFAADLQLRCLRAYNELAPRLLAEACEPCDVSWIMGGRAPRMELSSTLQFSEVSLTRPVVAAGREGDLERARAWVEAIAIEALSGPEREVDFDRLRTLCRAAGAWLSIEKDPELRHHWLRLVRKAVDEAGHGVSVWSSFYFGIGEVLGNELGHDLGPWFPRDVDAAIGLGRALSQFAASEHAIRYWLDLNEQASSPWLSIRACDAFLYRESKESRTRRPAAREMLIAGWQKVESESMPSPELLAAFAECAVEARSSEVLAAVAGTVRRHAHRARALGRIVIDVLLREEAAHDRGKTTGRLADGPPWRLFELPQLASVEPLLEALIEGTEEPEREEKQLSLHDHTWSNEEIRKPLGWLAALLGRTFESGDGRLRALSEEQRTVLLRWVGGWIHRILLVRDRDCKICSRIATEVRREGRVTPELRPLVDAVIGFFDSTEDVPVHLEQRVVLDLIKGGYRQDDLMRILDDLITLQSHHFSFDSVVDGIAINLARNGHQPLAERYLGRMESVENRALVEDQIADHRGTDPGERLRHLAQAPPRSAVLRRMAEICKKACHRLDEFDEDIFSTVVTYAVRLAPYYRALETELAETLGSRLSADQQQRLTEESARLKAMLP